MGLIRSDLTTVWCEVTSSLGTRILEVESFDFPSTSKSAAPSDDSPPAPKEEVMELLLCLRPIRDGEKKVDESLRFVSPNSAAQANFSKESHHVEVVVSSSSGDPTLPGGSLLSGSGSNQDQPKGPPKKRPPQSAGNEAAQQQKKKQKIDGGEHSSSDTEKSVVESLMLMNKASQ